MNGCLMVKVKSQAVPEQESIVSFLKNGIAKLHPSNVSRVIVQGFAAEQSMASWRAAFTLEGAPVGETSHQGQSAKSGNGLSKPEQSLKASTSAKFLEQTTSLRQKTLAFVKTRNGERGAIALGSCLLTSLFWFGVGGVSSNKESQPAAQGEVSAPSEVTADAPVNDVFTPKKIPVLGTAAAQLQDQATVLEIIVNGQTATGSQEIPKVSMAGIEPNPIAVKMGYPPAGTDVCNLPYSALIRPMYEQCIKEGMTLNQVSSILGWEGEETTSSGSSKTYRWGDGDSGSMFLTFENNRLISKSQTKLKP